MPLGSLIPRPTRIVALKVSVKTENQEALTIKAKTLVIKRETNINEINSTKLRAITFIATVQCKFYSYVQLEKAQALIIIKYTTRVKCQRYYSIEVSN